MNNNTISVIIPVKNEASNIRSCIDGILAQTIEVEEIIILDSGSTDGTLEIINEFPIVKVIHINPSDFNHGETRNVGVGVASGEFVLMTVGDAIPADNLWIEHLLQGFDEGKVACVFGQQIVSHDLDKNPMEWFMPANKPSVKKIFVGKGESFENLRPSKQKEYCSLDNVTALYKKDALEKIPFQKVTYGEDIIWAKEALTNKYSIVFNSHAKIYHYHNTDYEFDFKRTFSIHYLIYKLFNYVPELKNDNLFFLRVIKRLLFENRISIKEKFSWFNYNIKQKRAIMNSSKLFINTIKTDVSKLDKIHSDIAGTPPIPLKSIKERA